MEFNSLAFLFFLSFTFCVYWLIPKRYQWLSLLVLSYYFYLSWRPAYGAIIFLTTTVTYFSALGISRYPKFKKFAVVIGILVNLAVLFIFKYFNFFDVSLNSLFPVLHLQFSLPQIALLLPIGISFYIFESISYVFDVYKNKIEPEKHFGIFALFILFFPKIVAGPIERGGHLLPQLHKGHSFDYERTVSGLQLFTLGLFKKAVIADNLALVVNRVFNQLPNYKGLSLVITIFFFAWQIYADFSGYTDMARGAARILGFSLVENFDRPYASNSISEFWRRWHISLSSWIRDYIYIPLGGNRKGAIRGYLNVIIAFTLCGVWHGAAWNFVLWGTFHGVFLVLERIGKAVVQDRFKIPNFISLPYTFSIVFVSWIFFRARSFIDIIYILRNSVVGAKNFISPAYIEATLSKLFVTNRLEMAITLGCLAFIILLEIIPSRQLIKKTVQKQPLVIRFTLYTIVLATIVLLRNVNIIQFIYVNF